MILSQKLNVKGNLKTNLLEVAKSFKTYSKGRPVHNGAACNESQIISILFVFDVKICFCMRDCVRN